MISEPVEEKKEQDPKAISEPEPAKGKK